MKNEKISYLTKERIASSLKGLMKKKSFDKITVKDISDDCDISRSAFYYHFEDMYDLMKWTFESEALELLKASENSIDWDDGILSGMYMPIGKSACAHITALERTFLRKCFMMARAQ